MSQTEKPADNSKERPYGLIVQSTQTKCVRRLTFCAGHRVMGHESKCSHLHGHNYVVEAHAMAERLDSVGRVIDFSVVKDKLGGWLESEWDHGMILNADDRHTINAVLSMACNNSDIKPPSMRHTLGHDGTDGRGRIAACRQKLYLLLGNPTAEVMARYLLDDVCPKLFEGTGVRIVCIRLWETENCSAIVSPE